MMVRVILVKHNDINRMDFIFCYYRWTNSRFNICSVEEVKEMNVKAPPHMPEAGWYILIAFFMIVWMWMFIKVQI